MQRRGWGLSMWEGEPSAGVSPRRVSTAVLLSVGTGRSPLCQALGGQHDNSAHSPWAPWLTPRTNLGETGAWKSRQNSSRKSDLPWPVWLSG